MEKQLWEDCSNGKVKKVIKLLRNEQININWQDSEFERTPFYIACEKGHIDIVKLLLSDSRVDINKEDKYGWTPFYIACQEGRTKIVKLLNDQRVDINKEDEYGWTPLLIACQEGYIEIMKLLLNDQRIDINKARNDGSTPLSIACQHAHIEIVKYLLASGREIDTNKKDDDGKTGLDWAREREEMEMDEWESEEEFQERKRGCGKIVKLIESFEENPNETRTKLRIQLGLAGKSFLIFLFFKYQNLSKILIIFQDKDAVSIHSIIVLLSDCYLDFKNKELKIY